MQIKRKIVLFGTGKFSIMMSSYIQEQTNWEICAYVVEQQYITQDNFQGKPLLALETIKMHCPPNQYDMFLGLGYRKMNTVREKVFQQVKEKGYEIPNFISPQSCIGPGCTFEEGNIVLENATIAAFSRLGNSNIIWNGCNISHQAEISDFNYFGPSAVLGGCVKVANNCFLGINCTVKSRMEIASFTLIGATCYLKQSTSAYEVHVPPCSYRLENRTSLDMNL